MANVATPRMCQTRIRMQAPVIDCIMMGNVQACTRSLALADCYAATRLWLVSYVRTTYFVQANDAIKTHSRAVGIFAGSWRTTVGRGCKQSMQALVDINRRPVSWTETSSNGPSSNQSGRADSGVHSMSPKFSDAGWVLSIWAMTKGLIETLRGRNLGQDQVLP